MTQHAGAMALGMAPACCVLHDIFFTPPSLTRSFSFQMEWDGVQAWVWQGSRHRQKLRLCPLARVPAIASHADRRQAPRFATYRQVPFLQPSEAYFEQRWL